jgi:hypothetical protein
LWNGSCTAVQRSGGAGESPASPAATASGLLSEDDLKHGCNLGYARACPRLPAVRSADAVRFGVACDRDQRIRIQFVLEAGYRPRQHGLLEYDCASARWVRAHRDLRIQRMAACYLESYLLRRQAPKSPSRIGTMDANG